MLLCSLCQPCDTPSFIVDKDAASTHTIERFKVNSGHAHYTKTGKTFMHNIRFQCALLTNFANIKRHTKLTNVLVLSIMYLEKPIRSWPLSQGWPF